METEDDEEMDDENASFSSIDELDGMLVLTQTS